MKVYESEVCDVSFILVKYVVNEKLVVVNISREEYTACYNRGSFGASSSYGVYCFYAMCKCSLYVVSSMLTASQIVNCLNTKCCWNPTEEILVDLFMEELVGAHMLGS